MSEITVVGCGAMGSRLVNAFMNAGHNVVVVDIVKEKAIPFIERGARYSETLQEAPETETIVMNAPRSEIARKIISSCTKERLEGKYFINTTTAACLFDVEETARLAESMGMRYLEAKIESYPDTVGPETGYMVYAGNREVFEKTKDMLAALGKAVFIGEDSKWAWIGDMAVIGVHHGASLALFEIAALCLRYGYPMEKLCEIVTDTLPLCLQVNYKQIEAELKNYDGTFKDTDGTDIIIEERGSHMVLDALESSGVSPLLSQKAVEIFQEGIDAGYGRKSAAALVNIMLKK